MPLDYLNTIKREDGSLVNARLKAISKTLPEDLEKAFVRTWEMVKPTLEAAAVKGERSRIIFACASEDLVRIYRLGVKLEPTVVLDDSPFLLPLARLRRSIIRTMVFC